MSNHILMGVVAGDMIGSVYERFPTKELDFPLFSGTFSDKRVGFSSVQCVLTLYG